MLKDKERELHLPFFLRQWNKVWTSTIGAWYTELKTATKNFPPDSVLGEGGFGRVYKGWVDKKTMAPTRNNTGMTVVVKKLNSKSMQGYEQWQVTKILPFFSFIYSTYWITTTIMLQEQLFCLLTGQLFCLYGYHVPSSEQTKSSESLIVTILY